MKPRSPASPKTAICSAGRPSAVDRDFDWLCRHLPTDGAVDLRYGSDRDAALMVMGPRSRALLAKLTDADLGARAMPWMSARMIDVAGRPVTAMRVSYVGELGWELHLATHDLSAVYEALWEAGADLGLVDFGSYALNAMRLEKGYHGWGLDFGTEYTLFDAGLSKFVKVDKRDFIGREAVLDQRKTAPDWQFVGFEVESGFADPQPSDPILLDGRVVGYVTSGGMGFRIGKRIALGYVEGGMGAVGRTFQIEILGTPCRATVAPTPFYDPTNARLKS